MGERAPRSSSGPAPPGQGGGQAPQPAGRQGAPRTPHTAAHPSGCTGSIAAKAPFSRQVHLLQANCQVLGRPWSGRGSSAPTAHSHLNTERRKKKPPTAVAASTRTRQEQHLTSPSHTAPYRIKYKVANQTRGTWGCGMDRRKGKEPKQRFSAAQQAHSSTRP